MTGAQHRELGLGGAPITKLVLHIEHKDPVFRYTAQATVDSRDVEESKSFASEGTAAATLAVPP